MSSSASFLIFATFMDVGGVGGAFVGGGAFGGGGGGGCHGSVGPGGMKSPALTTRGGAAGGGTHGAGSVDIIGGSGGAHAGKFAHGFSSESLGEKVELSSSLWVRSFRALFTGLTDSAVLIVARLPGIGGGGEGRGPWLSLDVAQLTQPPSLSCPFTLSSVVLNSFSSNCFSQAAFSIRSLILLISSRASFALARRHRRGGSVLVEVAVAAVACSKSSCWEPPVSFEPAAVREETTQVCSCGDAPLTSLREFLVAPRRS